MRSWLVLMSMVVLGGCPRGGVFSPPSRQRLAVEPTILSIATVKGGQLMSSSEFGVFTLVKGEFDRAGLGDASKRCAIAKICGPQVKSTKVARVYDDLERAPWALAVLGDRLIAISQTSERTQLFVSPTDLEGIGQTLSSGGLRGLVLCSPNPTVHPQCPPPPLPPRDGLLLRVLRPTLPR